MILAFPVVGALLTSARAGDAISAKGQDDSSAYRLAIVPPDATNGLGSWIWASQTFNMQICRLWKEFDIPPGTRVTSARMKMTADDGYQFFLDGRELGQGATWCALTEYDLTRLLSPGHHVLAVSCFNDFFQAGLIMDLRIQLNDGRTLDIRSDASWRVAPENEKGWARLRHPGADWPAAALITGTNCAPQWLESRWPLDFVIVPPFQPVVIPFWQTGWFHLLLASVSGLFFLACVILFLQVVLHNKEQQLLNLERARIARDIHDDFGTRLTRLVLEGEVAQNELADEAQVQRHFSRISDGLRQALEAMDEVLWAVNPRRDTVGDFVTYVCEYAQTFLQPTAIQCLLEVEPDMPPLHFDLPLRRSLLLAVKEAITNAAKHSGATKMLLQIRRQEFGLAVIVEDNGKGFDPAQTGGERNGVGNMIQRMAEVGGRCVVVSQPGNGCRVEFRIPLTRQRSRLGWLAHWWRAWLDRGNKSAAPRATEATAKKILEA